MIVEEDIVALWLVKIAVVRKCKRYLKFRCNRLQITGTVARGNSHYADRPTISDVLTPNSAKSSTAPKRLATAMLD